MISRRSLLRGVGAALAAPAIVRVASLMPVRSMPPLALLSQWVDVPGRTVHEFVFRTSLPVGVWRAYSMGVPYGGVQRADG